MPVLHIKDFPPDLARALKVAAAREGKTLRDFVIALLRERLKAVGTVS